MVEVFRFFKCGASTKFFVVWLRNNTDVISFQSLFSSQLLQDVALREKCLRAPYQGLEGFFTMHTGSQQVKKCSFPSVRTGRQSPNSSILFSGSDASMFPLFHMCCWPSTAGWGYGCLLYIFKCQVASLFTCAALSGTSCVSEVGINLCSCHTEKT